MLGDTKIPHCMRCVIKANLGPLRLSDTHSAAPSGGAKLEGVPRETVSWWLQIMPPEAVGWARLNKVWMEFLLTFASRHSRTGV